MNGVITPEKKPEPRVTDEVLQQIITLVTGGLSLVAALAWNDAIRALVDILFPEKSNVLIVQFIYAIFITAVVVIVSMRLRRLSPKKPNP